MSGFFRGHKRRGSYDLFSSYNHFLPGYGSIVALVVLFIAGALIGDVLGDWFLKGMSLIMDEPPADGYKLLIAYPVSFVPAMLFASTMSRLNEHRTDAVPLDRKLKDWSRPGLLITASIFATIAAAYIVEPSTYLLPEMPADLKTQLEAILSGLPFWATLLSVSVFAPVFEEWLCRGLILRGLLKKTSPAVAILISALVFALIHGNIWQGVSAFCLGALFGYVYYRTGSLKLTMIMHCANNTLAAILSQIPQFKDAETFMDVLSPWAYWSIYALCILIVLSSIVLLRSAQPRQDCQACQHQ